MATRAVKLPDEARVALAQAASQVDALARGIALGLGLGGQQWRFDPKLMVFLVDEPDVEDEIKAKAEVEAKLEAKAEVSKKQKSESTPVIKE